MMIPIYTFKRFVLEYHILSPYEITEEDECQKVLSIYVYLKLYMATLET